MAAHARVNEGVPPENEGVPPGPESAEAAGDPGPEDQRGRDLSPLVIFGIAFGILALVAAAAGVVAVVTHGFRPKTVVTYRPAVVFSLRPGDCLDSGPNGLAITRLSCTTPHDAEVFATFTLSGAWPGDAAARQEAGDGCASRLAGYLNPQLTGAGLAQEFVYPNRDAWRTGVRTVVCEVRAAGGRLTGSVRSGADG